MSHIKFEENLKDIYEGINDYDAFIYYGRFNKLIYHMKQDKDFRYAIPLFLLKLFSYSYFEHTQEIDPELNTLLKGLYIRTRRIALAVKRSSQSINKLAEYHRCIPPKINVDHMTDDSASIPNTLVELPNQYKMQSSFFYENLCRFNLFGPLYVGQKDKERANSKTIPWTRLKIEHRKLTDCNCVIEYYIYTGRFPIEGKYVKKDNPHSRLYVKPTVEELRIAIKKRDPVALGRNISQYEYLPLTVKRSCATFIKDNRLEIKKHIRKSEIMYLTAWATGNYSFTTQKESA
jgi:hypothetical protein